MTTIPPPNIFDSGDTDCPPDKAAAAPRQSEDAAAEIQSSCGDDDENLQVMQSGASTGGFSPEYTGERRLRIGMQDLHETETARQASWPSETYLRSDKGQGAGSGEGCSSLRQDIETELLRGLSLADSGKAFGRTSRGLFEAASGDLGLPELSRDRTFNLEASRLKADGFEACGSVEGHALEGVELIGKCRNEPTQRPCNGRSEVTTTREAGIESGPQEANHIGEIFVGAAKLEPVEMWFENTAYPREDELLYEVLDAMDNPHERDLPHIPDEDAFMSEVEDRPLFLRRA